jgi:hypothetical protein
MSGNIRLSPRWGLNCAIPVCFWCNKDKNEILLPGRLFAKIGDDTEAPRKAVWDKVPCDECKKWMEQGVLFISVDEKKSAGDLNNPYRTGGWAVIKDEAVKRLIQPPELLAQVLKQRVCFLPDEVWELLGLPRGERNAEGT